jgi:hypothetical protein
MLRLIVVPSPQLLPQLLQVRLRLLLTSCACRHQLRKCGETVCRLAALMMVLVEPDQLPCRAAHPHHLQGKQLQGIQEVQQQY